MARAKFRIATLFALASPFCLPLIFIIRVIRPLITIRFIWLPSRLIGHAVLDPEMHLCRAALNLTSKEDGRFLDLYFFESTQHSNGYWKKMVERHLPVHRFYYYLNRFNKIFPGWQPHSPASYGELHSTADPDNLLGRIGPQIRFNVEEEQMGLEFLKKLGIPNNGKFVCIQIRDSAHDAKLNPVGLSPRYNEYRNSDVSHYTEAFEFLVQRGYWVIRMGKLTADPLQINHPKIIDYSNSGERTEFLDLWLCVNCTFMLSTGSGIDALAAIGRKPIVCVDFLAYMDTTYFFRNSIIIFKHLYETKTGRKLPLKEIVERESETYYKSSDFYWSRNIEWRENTAQEIREAVEEMHARIEGSWVESPVDEELQRVAGSMIAGSAQYQSQYKNGFVHRLGAKFLRSL